ncbi:hypothetical protein NDU88_006760 [Pleurodeles waltl]|uniref:Uncharacterized protein n=1 Tax=Pleurodeles waltl TaxID=8319 RepID=A0AAV7QLP8_PLEWA|nr:hypothetical protein NDU88_006760 [Pleurodeles waltl]
MPRTMCTGSTDRCGRFSAFWLSLPGSGPQRQAPEGPARIGERGARSRPTLLSLLAKRDSRRFLAILVGVWGVWDTWMAPKIIRTPRSLRARQNQDPGGTRKDKKLPVPGSKEHSNLHVKGGPHKTTDMEKDARRKSVEQTEARSSSGAKLRRDPIKPQEEDGEMQWDYTATQQAFSKRDSVCSTLVPPPTGDLAVPPSLDLIYRTMVQKLSIKKVVKSCQDIGARIATMETRTEELEIEVKAATAQTMTQGQQISDIQWKLEDAENRQRRNNLRILGIAEDLEGQDTRAYIASLFKKAFPDLNGWDWEKEIQRAHRFR